MDQHHLRLVLSQVEGAFASGLPGAWLYPSATGLSDSYWVPVGTLLEFEEEAADQARWQQIDEIEAKYRPVLGDRVPAREVMEQPDYPLDQLVDELNRNMPDYQA